MIAAGIALVLGLVVLFLGMAILEQERKDKKKLKKEREERVATSDEQSLAAALVDNEQPIAFADIRRAKLGAFMVAQGVLLAIVGIALFVINAYWIAIPWYVSVPVIVVLVLVIAGTDAYMMGAPEPKGTEGDVEGDAQEVGECTEKEATNGEDSEA